MIHKILFVHGNSNNIAGQEIALLNTIKGLSNLGLDCNVLLPKTGRFDTLLKDSAIRTFHITLNRLHKKNPLPYIKTVYSVYRLIKREKISTIHCSGAYPTQYCLPAARMAKIPCISHIHASVYTKEEIKKSFVPYADYVIAVSDSVRSLLIELGCPAFKTETVYYGILSGKKEAISAKEKYAVKTRFNISPQEKVVGQIGQIIPRKGLEYFIAMAAEIKRTSSNVKFMIVGDAPCGHEAYEKQLRKMVKDANLSGDIIFTGFQDEINKIISTLDISVLSSLSEALPLVIIQSLALAKPVIATSVNGIPEVIIDGNTGLLVPPKDSNALAQAVLSLLTDPHKAKRLGENGREFVLEKFSRINHAKAILRIYNTLLNKTAKRTILLYDSSSGFGGAPNALANIVNNLAKEKFYPVIAIKNSGSQTKKIRNAEIVRLADHVEPDKLSNIGFFFYFIKNILPEAISIYLLNKRKRISMVHINNKIMEGIPAIIASKLAGIPCICHIRDTKRLIKREKLFSRWVKKFIVLNKHAYEMHKQDISQEKLHIICDGVDLKGFDKAERGDFRRDFKLGLSPLVGLVGRIVEGKGHREFVLAAKEVLRLKPDVAFAVIGDTKGTANDSYYKEIKELVEKENLEKDIIFTGWRNDVENVIAGLDIAVQASTNPEGFGLTVIEAMVLEKTVIATNVPGPSDTVIDGETGLLVPPGNPGALAEAILKLLDNPALARQMGKAGRERVEKLYDINKTVSEIENIYKSCDRKEASLQWQTV